MLMVVNQKNQKGFITMIVLMVVVLALVIGLAYIRVKHANN